MKPPCKPNGVLCASHELGCRFNCDAYKEWDDARKKAKEKADAEKALYLGVNEILFARRYKARKDQDYRRMKKGWK